MLRVLGPLLCALYLLPAPAQDRMVESVLPDLIFSPPAVVDKTLEQVAEVEPSATPTSQAWWLLSLFAPTTDDTIEWERGAYSLVSRGGRVESPARSGDLKKLQNMVSEGSVLLARSDPRGSAADVAPDGFPHPVYRAGFAVAIPIPQAPS